MTFATGSPCAHWKASNPWTAQDIGRHMLALSTYLGHASVANTYWYLEATPVLLGQGIGCNRTAACGEAKR